MHQRIGFLKGDLGGRSWEIYLMFVKLGWKNMGNVAFFVFGIQEFGMICDVWIIPNKTFAQFGSSEV